MLASDLNNPEFMNPQNPDSMLFVEFYWHAPLDANKSAAEGKKIYGEKVPYVRISRPGDTTSVIETAVREDHKKRWPEKWLYWQMKEGLIDGGREMAGWNIDEWPILTDEQRRELKYKRFYVVEQIAGASDSQLQSLGMGGMGLREQAKKAMRERMGAETKDALAQKDSEIADMKARMERLEAALMAQQPTDVVTTEVPEWTVLAEKYQEKFGRKAHPKMKLEKLREQVNG